MKPCTKVGLNVTWRCNWKCGHCFYVRSPEFHSGTDADLPNLFNEIDHAKRGGMDHAVVVGWGEPALCRNMLEILQYCHLNGLNTSMITNGTAGLQAYKNFFSMGMDHAHLSCHGIGKVATLVTGAKNAYMQQEALKDWMDAAGLAHRVNTTMQLLNYMSIPAIIDQALTHNLYQYVFLGFLPLYEWADGHIRDILVHPGELRPYIEEGADKLIAAGVHFSIRYHPMCHLAPRYWKYVTNAQYVPYDPFEWNYTVNAHDHQALWKHAFELRDAAGPHGPPCTTECKAWRHCGGWNRRCIDAFDGADIKAIMEVPAEYQDVWEKDGGLFDLNPANGLVGTLNRREHLVRG